MKILKSLILVSMVCVAMVARAQDYSFKEQYKVTSPASLEISSSDGNIEVLPGAENEIQVLYQVKKGGRLLSISKSELSDEFIFEVENTANRLKISVKNKLDYHSISFWKLIKHEQINVDFKIYVPKVIACSLHTSDGNIVLGGVSSDQQCKTSDGNVTISNIAGNVTAGTSDGHIQINNVKGAASAKTSDGNIVLQNIIGDVQSGTSDGNITLNGIKGFVSARTSDGHIAFTDISGSMNASTSDGHIKGNFLELKGELTAKTGDGSITITLPDHLGLDLEIRGSSLNVPLANFSGRSDEKVIRGKCNGGGIAVNLTTSDGHITLAYR